MRINRYRRTRTVAALAVVLAVTVASAGCMWAPDLARVCRDLEKQVPGASFDREFAMTLGPVSLAFAKMVTAFIPDAREARGYLRDVSRIEVAVYEVTAMPTIDGVRMPNHLQRLRDEGWETAVKVRDDDNIVWLMYRIEKNAIREMYVVVLDSDELVLVKARGRLDRLAARALLEADNNPGVPHLRADAAD